MGWTSPQLSTASLMGQVGGAASSAIGSYFSASAQRTTMKAQAYVADVNSRIAELGAQSELMRGQQQAAALGLQVGKLKSRQRVAMAANGIDVGTGSAAEIAASTDIMKEIDLATIEGNAIRSAWGYRTTASNYQNEAASRRATAGGVSPFGAAATSLLGSAGSVAQSWYALNKSGAFGAQGQAGSGLQFDYSGDAEWRRWAGN